MAARRVWYDRAIHTSWAVYGWAVRQASPRPSGAFAHDGFVVGCLPEALVAQARDAVSRSRRIEMTAGDCLPGYRSSEKVYKVAGTLNAGHRYFRPEGEELAVISRVLDHLGPAVRDAMGSEWCVVNTRIVETLPNAEIMGPNAWHGDGFPPDLLKVMLYLSAPGRETGTTEFQIGDRTTIIEGPAGTWVLFRNSVLIHRGVPPARDPRLAVEVTLMPALRRRTTPVFAGLNATYPEYPWSARRAWDLLPGREADTVIPDGRARTAPPTKDDRAREKTERAAHKQALAAEKAAKAEQELRARRRRQRRVRLANVVLPIRSVNLGGGSEFVEPGWRNLEGSAGPANPTPFLFSPACRFPLRNGSVTTVYSSHCFEHLDDATVARVLAEARRVIRQAGRLVIKLPDFDRALAAWRAGEPSFFDEDRWGLRRLKALWPVKGVADTLDARASMIFCGFWNDEYGEHFGARTSRDGAYHGPAAMPAEQLAAVRDLATPHDVAAALRAWVVAHEPSFHFNHQNAWSRQELRALLGAHGFECVTFDSRAVVEAAADIPSIEAARDESLYCLARPG
jgi:SAM-dependent methyltransferase